jgi:putative ABC transport system permease protein
VITREPDRVAGAFSLGPRLMISQAALAASGLIQPGSRVRYRHLLKLPEGLPAVALVRELEAALAAEGAQVSAYDDAQPRLRRFIDNLTTYLGLVGLISLLIGGIGVANSVQAFLKQKLETIAMLKCLGADGRMVLSIYLLQTLLLGGLGSLAGVALGVGVQWTLPSALSFLVPVEIDRSAAPLLPPPLPMIRGVVMGVLTALLFSLWPLLAVRQIPPARLLRREVDDEGMRSGGRRPWLTAALIVAGLALLALWQIGRLDLGATVIGLLAASLLALWAIALVTMRVVRTLPRARSLAVRQGLANLHRPGSRAMTAILSVGVGVTVILAIALIEASLLRQVDEHLPSEAPSLFFIDLQHDQREPFAQLLAGRGLVAGLTPIVRGRLTAIGDRQVAQMKLEGRSDGWYFQREYVVTMQPELPKGNRLVGGAWWGAAPGGPAGPLISVEQEAARHLGVGVGSRLTFDMQGQPVTATVASLREVYWGSLTTNFFIIFSPGALEGLPLTYIATARTTPAEDLPLQRAVVAAFPNITAINIRHVLEAVGAILERIALVVRIMALFTIVTGLLVLAGAIATTRYRRLREAVILKTLGATRAVIARIFAVEYLVLGAVAGLIGVIMAALLSFILLTYFMNVPWQPEPATLAAGLLASALLTVLTGFLATARLLGRKPLAVLRQE